MRLVCIWSTRNPSPIDGLSALDHSREVCVFDHKTLRLCDFFIEMIQNKVLTLQYE